MKKTKRYLFLLVALLMALVVRAYKIEAVNATFGSIPVITYGSGATPVTVNTTDIPSGQIVTMTVTPNDGYYLSSLVYEEVTPLDIALAPRRAPNIQTIHTIPIQTTLTYAEAHFGGTYTFMMPEDDVIITATFIGCKDITYDDNITFALSGSAIYDGTTRGLVVSDNAKAGDVKTIALNLDYNNIVWTYPAGSSTVKNAGTYRATITGIGMYTGTKSSGDLVISNRTLNVTAEAKYKTYGEADPALTYTYNGLLNGDVITGALSRDPGETVSGGPYTIRQGTLAATNYYINYSPSTLTINPKNIGSTATITQSETYYNYDANNDQKATITSVKDGETTLTNGTDYDYAYSSEYYPTDGENNRRADIHYITVTFKGNYTGSRTVEYQIRKDVTLNSLYRWRTYYETEVNMRVPAGFKAYTLNSVGETQVELDERQYIKKGVPMLLYRTDNATGGFFPEVVQKNDENLDGINSDSRFRSTTENTTVASLQSANSGKDIWILVNDEFVRTESGTIPAYKCYLLLDNGTIPYPALAMRLNTTGVEQIANTELSNQEPKESRWYTLDGRRLESMPTKKGIYINQGKKIVIK